MSEISESLNIIGDQIREDFSAKDGAREKVLPLCRATIRSCSETIRAIHRHEFDQASQILSTARQQLADVKQAFEGYEEFGHSGFVLDAQKEFAEANLTLAIVTGKPLPSPGDLAVDPAAYLNGLGEAGGELRRYLLDSLRRGDLSRGEGLLSAMDDIYGLLVTMDFPDAITGGLRRTTDMVRGVLERTRSDLTLATEQKDLADRLDRLEGKIP